jgi:hypothetical protein
VVRAWLQGDNHAAIDLIGEDLRHVEDEVKIMPWYGVWGLLRVVEGVPPAEAFGTSNLTGHHANWAARAFAVVIWNLRTGQPAESALREAEHHLRHTPFWRHLLRTVVAPITHESGLAGEGCLREADAFCAAAGEHPLQRRLCRTLAGIGAPVPMTGPSAVPPHLARLGITAREADGCDWATSVSATSRSPTGCSSRSVPWRRTSAACSGRQAARAAISCPRPSS